MSVPLDTSKGNQDGSVLQKVASFTMSKTDLESQITKPKFVPEKLDFQLYEKFEGKWINQCYDRTSIRPLQRWRLDIESFQISLEMSFILKTTNFWVQLVLLIMVLGPPMELFIFILYYRGAILKRHLPGTSQKKRVSDIIVVKKRS